MKIVLNILKAFLINFLFIGIIHAATLCPSITPKAAGSSAPEQVEAILNDVVCSFIDLNKNSGESIKSTLNLAKKKIIPFIDLEHSTEIALGGYWSQLDTKQRKIFERDIKNSLINEYVGILSEINQWEEINIKVDDQYSQNGNTARVKVSISLDDDASANATVTLKLINKERWKLYDLEYQSISILDIEKIGYDSKIKRQGIEKLVEKMLSKS
ncbi:ABC transporter substrate-binding protein [Candidatus Thioglobus sp.]|nr:ABC transporter substrate-binding protein [Candidatus Thioglobus sp.]